jgi:rhomboid family GlyGly-CTERM serine protease
LSVSASKPRSTSPFAWTTLLVAALACAAQLFDAGHLALVRDRMAGFGGWQLWTGHFVHYSASHLGWNLVTLVWAERLAPAQTRIFYSLAPPFISAILWLDPHLDEYRGLSGIVMGLVALVALHQLRHDRSRARWIWPVALALVAAKLGWEMWRETAMFASLSAAEDIRVVPLAHVAGVAAATAIHLWPARNPDPA